MLASSMFHGMSPTSAVILSVALMLFLGFAATRLTKLARLPNVTAYILTGILIGPWCLDLIPVEIAQGMDFLSDIALAFIAFSTGEYFRLSVLRRSGGKVILITVAEACLASVLVFCLTYGVLRLPLRFSAVIAALAAATAPASTMMTIRQTGAHGDFVDTLLQVVALDDIVALLAYSAAISLASAGPAAGGARILMILKPLGVNLLVIALGAVFGLALKLLIHKKRTTDNRLIITLSLLFAFCGVCSLLDISPLLGCMSMGMAYVNLADDNTLFQQMAYFSPPILLLFFVRSGVCFDLHALLHPSGSLGRYSLLSIGVAYFFIRIVGKYAGAYLGCLAAGKERKVRNFLGLALVPQAGVAIGLAALGARTLGGETGVALNTIILASSVLYELVGPALAKLSLSLSGSYSDKLEDLAPVDTLDAEGRKKAEVQLLIERIRAIQEKLPEHPLSPEEEAFTAAAQEYRMVNGFYRRRPFGR